MSRHSSHSKEPVIDFTSSPISKRTCQSSGDFDNMRFKTLLDSQSFSNNFKSAPTVVERVVRFDTLGSTFIPKIFAKKDGQACLVSLRIPLTNWLKSSI